MSTRNFQVFMTPTEFAEFLEATATDMKLRVMDDEFASLSPDAAQLANYIQSGRYPARLYLGRSDSEVAELEGIPNDAIPAAQGWVQVDSPFVDGNILFLSDIGSKSDWYQAGVIREGPGHALYTRITRQLRPQLSSPVTGTNIIYGGVESYPDLHYSRGAAEWQSQGGELRQYGVDNVRFLIPSALSETK
jgi:hypothetical protein